MTPSASPTPSWLALRVPPLLLTALAGGLMVLLPATPALPAMAAPWPLVVSVLLVALGSAVCVAGVLAFRQADTTVDPTRPAAASALVARGIYRYSRNPMYLGFLLWLVALAWYLGSLWAWLVLPAFVAYLHHAQIRPEEQALSARFGADFTAYCQRVRRWI